MTATGNGTLLRSGQGVLCLKPNRIFCPQVSSGGPGADGPPASLQRTGGGHDARPVPSPAAPVHCRAGIELGAERGRAMHQDGVCGPGLAGASDARRDRGGALLPQPCGPACGAGCDLHRGQPACDARCRGELAAMGAGGATCFASGWTEAGEPELQQKLVAAAGDMPILGPNCYGVINYLDGALLWPDQHGGRRVERGVALLSQSSNIVINLTMQKRGLPVAYVACLAMPHRWAGGTGGGAAGRRAGDGAGTLCRGDRGCAGLRRAGRGGAGGR